MRFYELLRRFGPAVTMVAAAVSYACMPGAIALAVMIGALGLLAPFCPFPCPTPLVVRLVLAVATGAAAALALHLFQLGYPAVALGMGFTAATTGLLFYLGGRR